jgi:phosphatidate cytidylyltransferase
LGTLYILIATLGLLFLLAHPADWEVWKNLYLLLILVWSTDTFAYIGGRLLKGPKLAPSISPNKTWSGFIVGTIGGTAVTYIASLWLLPLFFIFSLWQIMFLVVIAQGGDLLESKVKRWSDVKDSSSLIPGHGGLLDRLDSLLAVSFTLALLVLFLDYYHQNRFKPFNHYCESSHESWGMKQSQDPTKPFVLRMNNDLS